MGSVEAAELDLYLAPEADYRGSLLLPCAFATPCKKHSGWANFCSHQRPASMTTLAEHLAHIDDHASDLGEDSHVDDETVDEFANVEASSLVEEYERSSGQLSCKSLLCALVFYFE